MPTFSVPSSTIRLNTIGPQLLVRSGGTRSIARVSTIDRYPALTAPHTMDELSGNYYYQNFQTSGRTASDLTISLGSGAAHQAFNGSTMLTKVIDTDTYSSFTIRCDAEYPNYVAGIYTGANQSGDELFTANPPGSGNHSLTWTPLGSGYEETATIYFHIIDAHNP